MQVVGLTCKSLSHELLVQYFIKNNQIKKRCLEFFFLCIILDIMFCITKLYFISEADSSLKFIVQSSFKSDQIRTNIKH